MSIVKNILIQSTKIYTDSTFSDQRKEYNSTTSTVRTKVKSTVCSAEDDEANVGTQNFQLSKTTELKWNPCFLAHWVQARILKNGLKSVMETYGETWRYAHGFLITSYLFVLLFDLSFFQFLESFGFLAGISSSLFLLSTIFTLNA